MARTDDVIDAIKAMIMSGELSPGDRLPVEPDLAAQLDVSRSSLREGVRSLIAMGVLEARQGAGTYVTSLDIRLLFAPMEFVSDLHHQDPVEFLQVRRILECEAVAQAAMLMDPEEVRTAQGWVDRARLLAEGPGPTDHEALLDCDQAFHHVIAEACGNQALAALLSVFAGRTWRLRSLRSEADARAGDLAVREHQAILDAVRAGDPERARVLMHVHLLGVEDFARHSQTSPSSRSPLN